MRKKILVIGNSVGLRIRPENPIREKNTIFSLELERILSLSNSLVEVKNYCRGRHLIEEITAELDRYIAEAPDVVILVAGVTDACNREFPLWYSNLITRKQGLVRDLFMYFYLKIIARFRSFFVVCRGRRPWRSINFTRRGFGRLLDRLWAETPAKLIVLGIKPVDKRVENQLPGSNLNIEIINSYLEKKVGSFESQRVLYLSCCKLYGLNTPDGVHFDQASHLNLAKILAEKIEE